MSERAKQLGALKLFVVISYLDHSLIYDMMLNKWTEYIFITYVIEN